MPTTFLNIPGTVFSTAHLGMLSEEGKAETCTDVLTWAASGGEGGHCPGSRRSRTSGRHLQLTRANIRGITGRTGTRTWGHITVGKSSLILPDSSF